MIVCRCRSIDSEDYESEDDLRDRIMQDDWNCGQCQIVYLVKEDAVDTIVELGYN